MNMLRYFIYFQSFQVFIPVTHEELGLKKNEKSSRRMLAFQRLQE